MKKIGILALIAIVVALGFVFLKQEKNTTENTIQEGVQTLKGTISNIKGETDGDSMVFTDENGTEYETIISIPNLGPDSTFDFNDLVEGARLEITGEVWDLAGITQLTARKVKSLQKEYTEKTCAAEGGEWKPVGKAQIPACVFMYSDGGKSCSSSDECEGYCKVTEVDGSNPQCAYDSDLFGCGSSIEEFNETGGILCID